MFTGIVQGRARVVNCQGNNEQMQLQVALPEDCADNLQTGASIAINGTCLTITGFEGNQVSFDMIKETLECTNLGQLSVDQEVNFERAAKFGDEIGGHLISGHIANTAQLLERAETEANCTLWFSVPAGLGKYILPKGFIGLNGCSLTIGEVTEERFCVHLIPETLAITTFGDMQVGCTINLEVDPQTQAIVDTVERTLAQRNL